VLFQGFFGKLDEKAGRAAPDEAGGVKLNIVFNFIWLLSLIIIV